MARNKYDIDESLKKEFNMKSVKRLAHYIKPYSHKMIIALLLRITASAASMLTPIFLMKIMDEYIPMGEAGIPYIVKIGLLTLILTLYVALVICIKTKLMMSSGQGIIRDLRKDIFEHLQQLPFDYYDSRPHGKIQVRVVNYINNLSDLLSNGIVNMLVDLISLVVIIFYMFTINVQFTLICLMGMPILFLIVFIVKRKQREAWQKANSKHSNLNAYIAESITGIRVTQSFVREEKNTAIFNKMSDNYRTSWLHAIKYNLVLPPAVDMISIITTSIVFVISVMLLQNNSEIMTVGVITAFSGYISRFWTPITNMGNFYNSLLTAISYLELIFETIDEPVVVTDKENAIPLPSIKGDVEFKNVSFSYEDNIPILKNINFHVNAGEFYAIVGPTGAGKTTIINLISRFYNINEGSIFIDGYNIEDVTISSLRKQMGVMLQDSFIFSGTIMDNIRYGNLDASDEDIVKAAKIVCAHDFIMKMENGYNTYVNERGSRLSIGQRQLISFARALLANPKILILDEATSSIDTETEIALQKGLQELLKGRTSFIIAHRLSTIKNSSCIMYIDNGEIIEMDSHDNLIQQKGAYYNLYKSQYHFLNN